MNTSTQQHAKPATQGPDAQKIAMKFEVAAIPATALRRAEAAHGEHEKRTGGMRDANWSDWYAEYLVAEQAGKELPL